MKIYDIIIIGNGPAGLSAALYILRAKLSALVIGKDNGALEKADRIENYFGIHGSPSGNELIATGKNQVTKLGGRLINEEVLEVGKDRCFIVKTKENEYFSKAVILATGSARKTPKIGRLDEFNGKGVSYCAVCDAFFYRNKDVAVIGSGEYALHELKTLIPIVKSAVVLTNGKKPEANFSGGIRIINDEIKEIYGRDRLEGVIFTNGKTINLNGIFIALGSATAIDLARKIGAVTENNRIVVNENMETTVPALFAAGDCIGGVQQMSVAVGEGAKAALAAINHLRR